MKLGNKTTVIASIFGVILWSALFVLFYFSPNDYGSFGSIDVAQVRGVQVQRFYLSQDDTVLDSRKADSEYQFDTLLLVRHKDEEAVFVYVLRENEHVVFEKKLEKGFSSALWNQELGRFEITNTDTNKVFLLIPTTRTYILENAP